MIRFLQNSLREGVAYCFGSNQHCLQFYRWRRKPRWLPVAKSKVFRVPPRTIQPPFEEDELKALHNNYKTQMRTVRLFFREEVKRIRETSTADHLIITPEQEEVEFQKCVAENEAWNAKIAQERSCRLEKEWLAREEIIFERLDAAKERKEEELERIEEIVRKEKENYKSFITRETLEHAIEHALANPVDYNFALDIQGRMYKGRETKAPEEDPDSDKTVSVNALFAN